MPFEPRDAFVYMMSNWQHGVLYVGVTSNLINRVGQHRKGTLEGFTKKYQLKRLVWYRGYGAPIDAISFEKRLKRWRREWKFRLVEETNPDWVDLWPELTGLDVVGPLSHLQGR